MDPATICVGLARFALNSAPALDPLLASPVRGAIPNSKKRSYRRASNPDVASWSDEHYKKHRSLD
jgi:hypothetical protein